MTAAGSLLEAAAEALDKLAAREGPCGGSAYPVFLLAVGLLVLSRPGATVEALAAAAASLAALARLGGRERVTPAMIVAAASLAVTAPLMLQGGLAAGLDLAARAGASALLVAVVTAYHGWGVYTLFLERLGLAPLARGLELLPAAAARLLWRLAAMLLAREARSLREPGLAERWRLLASAAAGTLDYAYMYSRSLAMAAEARRLSDSARPRGGWARGLCPWSLAALASAPIVAAARWAAGWPW